MKKILLVDDNFDYLRILDHALSKYFETYTATGVTEAIKILEGKDIDLICSDFNMRDGTGLDLLQTAKLECIQAPFILLSGCDYNLDIKLAEQYGAKFIPKGDYELIKQIVAIANQSRQF